MSRITIIGAGISGPAAALALAKDGHEVTVYEQRQESELRSFGVIGITNENWKELTNMGMRAREYDNSYTTYGARSRGGYELSVTRKWNGHYVEWTNLHVALVSAARYAGVKFQFGSKWEAGMDNADYRIMAAGVGYAATNNRANYSGYVVYRGLSNLHTDYAWLSVADAKQRWNFKLAYTDNGAAWELYSHLPKPRPMGTTSIDAINPAAYEGLPAEFLPFILDSAEMYRAAISDWDVPESLFNGTRVIQIGDANGAMRPHTGMGANLGISEALHTPALLAREMTSAELVEARRTQHERGIEMGRTALGS
jgi:2-polyprenyl-6-methoxyphenol hydroxylase-like FAD-dependent oxidoreductase